MLTASRSGYAGPGAHRGKSFHWTGSYVKSLNEAQTLKTELNVFESFAPKVPAAYKDSEFLFLANIDPVLQSSVRQQMPKVRMVCGDTMNYWITGHRGEPGQSAHRAGCAADQRRRGQAAGRRQQPGSGRAQDSGHGSRRL